jgi:hypothetical protein
MSHEYHQLIERLTADAKKHGVRENRNHGRGRGDRVHDCTDTPLNRDLKFTRIVREFYNKHAYTYEYGMSSGSHALAHIEATLASFIDYPNSTNH